MVEFHLEIADVPAVDQGAVGAAEVSQKDPPPAQLDRRMLLAHLCRAKPELARSIAADQPAAGRDDESGGARSLT